MNEKEIGIRHKTERIKRLRIQKAASLKLHQDKKIETSMYKFSLLRYADALCPYMLKTDLRIQRFTRSWDFFQVNAVVTGS